MADPAKLELDDVSRRYLLHHLLKNIGFCKSLGQLLPFLFAPYALWGTCRISRRTCLEFSLSFAICSNFDFYSNQRSLLHWNHWYQLHRRPSNPTWRHKSSLFPLLSRIFILCTVLLSFSSWHDDNNYRIGERKSILCSCIEETNASYTYILKEHKWFAEVAVRI